MYIVYNTDIKRDC